MAFKFTRQFSMPGCRFSGLRLPWKRLKTADKEFICRPASTSSGFTVVPAVIYGVTPGCSIGRWMPHREKYSSSMKRDAWRSRFRDFALNTSAKTHRAAVGNLDDWLYEFQWQPKERAAGKPSAPASRASWLIFADSGGVGDALSALLEARGERSVLVARGESYEQTDGEHYRIRPERPEDIRRLFESALASDQPGCRGIVHLWSLDVARPEETTVASLNAAQTMGCGSVLLLVQELARTESPDAPRLWLITQGAQSAGEKPAPLSVAQSPLWGLGRVIAQEHPTFWGGLVDLESGASLRDAAAHQLCEEISSADGEDQLAFRQGRRYAARLVRQHASATPAPPLRWRTDGSYLISGGLGDLGLLVARWMVEQGARRLILLGRTKLPSRSNWPSVEIGSRAARQITAIRELESLGASVHLASVDVADEGKLNGFLDKFRTEGWPPIRGVVHAAGVLQD